MNITTKVIVILYLTLLASCKKPIDYYNKTVFAGNMAVSLNQMESRLERIEEGFEPEPINLVSRISLRLATNENYLEELKGFLGNSESDPMIKSAIAYLEYDITIVKNPETVAFLNLIDKKMNPEELAEILNQHENLLNQIYDTKTALWDIYDTELTKYAEANNIKENFYGPNLKPVEKEND